MVKKISLLYFLFSCIFCFAQTGPAGIGTSANNVLWLKADAGTSSTVNATQISSWNDQSGNSINVTQTVSVQQPSFAANVMNGFPAILFDNTATANQNDKMLGPDSPLLDNTSGYTFFTVTRPMNLDNSARTIVCKRTTVSVDESFMLFYYTGNKLAVDIQTTDDRFFTNTVYANSTNYITSLVYNGALASGLRCTAYNEDLFDRNAPETNTLVPDNASPLLIGSTDASDPRPYGGYISEIIIYREALNTASRIIINNHLSAKYNIALSANDKYAGDNPGNGNYDFSVAGLGIEASGSSPCFSASTCGGFGVSATSGLDNGDYIIAGHALATNTTITTDVGGMTGTNNARWQRIWYVDVTNTLANINVNVEFDMSAGGMGTFTLGPAANYVLLSRTGQTGNWTEVATASSIAGNKIFFNALSASGTDDGYYTLGTRNYRSSPLPIKLASFSAESAGNVVSLAWSTATEKNNNYFTVERSVDGIDFEALIQVKGAGTSSRMLQYKQTDAEPFEGLSYYRLKQTDFDGTSAYSGIVAVNRTDNNMHNDIVIYPNPNNGSFKIKMPALKSGQYLPDIKDLSGKAYAVNATISEDSENVYTIDGLAAGVYIITVSFETGSYKRQVIVK